MKTIEALGIITALNTITTSKRLVPSKFAYASAINRKRLTEVAEAFNEAHKNILDKYGQKDSEGRLVEKDGMITLTDAPAFQKEMTDLGEQTVDVKLHLVPLYGFPDQLTMAEMDALVPMVLEDPDDTAA